MLTRQDKQDYYRWRAIYGEPVVVKEDIRTIFLRGSCICEFPNGARFYCKLNLSYVPLVDKLPKQNTNEPLIPFRRIWTPDEEWEWHENIAGKKLNGIIIRGDEERHRFKYP